MESPDGASAACLPNNTGLDYLYNTNYHIFFYTNYHVIDHEFFMNYVFRTRIGRKRIDVGENDIHIFGENGLVSRFNSGDLAVLLTRIIMN